MSRPSVRPLEAADVPAAAALLARRHGRHRRVQPLLSPRYEEGTAATDEVAAALALDHASGAVAERDGRMIGYLLGAPKPGEIWGPNIWVEAAGQATEDAETMRDLYSLAAARWVDEGRTAQYVLVPAHDRDLVDAWFQLGFGQQHVHAIQPVPEPVPDRPRRWGVTIRRAVAADIPVLARLDVELPLHQSLSPTFSSAPPGTVEESEAEWVEDIDDPEYTTFVAERDGKVVGSAVGCSVEKSGAHKGVSRPDDAGFLGFASVFPDARGAGAGRALGEAVLDWAASAGYASVVTDWRATNLLSSRAWPALGFTPTFLRLHRLVGY